MTNAKVLVVEHERDAGIGFLREHLERKGLSLHTVGPTSSQAVPGSLDGYSGLIVMGGSMGPTEDHIAPWLPATRALLAEGVAREIPTLGICLGAQLLATATGGEVQLAQRGPEIGLCDVDVLEAAAGDSLFGELRGTRAPAVQWHWLEAATLPHAATLLATSAACPHQAFRLGRFAWAVQFHPEVLTPTVLDWFAGDAESVEQLGYTRTELVAAVRGAEDQLRQVWGGFAERFAAVVTQQHG